MTLRIITANVNGIRAAAKKGFFEWLRVQNPDIVCLQETKAQAWQLEENRALFFPDGYHCYYHDAEKKGYSGVAIYARSLPDAIIEGMGCDEYDQEGRYLEARFGNLSIISLYLQSGSAKEERQQLKYRCMAYLETVFQRLLAEKRDFIICGDWNIAHKTCDIRNWKANIKNSGFLPEERAWLDKLFNDWALVDGFRELEQAEHEYTWWSNRGQAFTNNVGWRIDYQILSPTLKGTVQATAIYKDTRFSDHAPLTIDYALRLAGG